MCAWEPGDCHLDVIVYLQLRMSHNRRNHTTIVRHNAYLVDTLLKCLLLRELLEVIVSPDVPEQKRVQVHGGLGNTEG